ncbi:uncharacterized protein LOC141899001 [Tubulanus polymorphus]|uniref:uncharacterized protein LOC141899001 n=1 Tax=Tubulanus polymorphus TaxID=672921 RepID=UPI003DA35FFE
MTALSHDMNIPERMSPPYTARSNPETQLELRPLKVVKKPPATASISLPPVLMNDRIAALKMEKQNANVRPPTPPSWDYSPNNGTAPRQKRLRTNTLLRRIGRSDEKDLRVLEEERSATSSADLACEKQMTKKRKQNIKGDTSKMDDKLDVLPQNTNQKPQDAKKKGSLLSMHRHELDRSMQRLL